MTKANSAIKYLGLGLLPHLLCIICTAVPLSAFALKVSKPLFSAQTSPPYFLVYAQLVPTQLVRLVHMLASGFPGLR